MRPPRPRRFRAPATIAALAAACALSACGIGFTDPVLADDDVVFEPRLVGTWDDTASGTWVEITPFTISGWEAVSPVTPRMYRVTYHDEDGDANRFEALYGPFSGRMLLQLRPAPPEPDLRGAFEQGLILELYGFVEIAALSDRAFGMRMPEPDSLIARVREVGGRLPFTETDERLVVTAPRDSLRTFLRDALARPGAWGDTTWFVRRR